MVIRILLSSIIMSAGAYLFINSFYNKCRIDAFVGIVFILIGIGIFFIGGLF